MLKLIYFPEFIFTVGILGILLIALFLKKDSFRIVTYLSILLLFITTILILYNESIELANYQLFFKNSLFIIFFKILIMLGSISTIVISFNYFKDLKLKKFEIPILILFSTLGMIIMVASNNLMSMYLGIELQSLSLYVLATIQRDSLKSSESGVKYFVLGALASGILLYGCSLMYGFTGSTNFTDIKNSLQNLDSLNIGIIFAFVFIIVGLAFKISAVPFHMWAPDVYEGAPTGITAFFAMVPKIAAIALIYRFCLEPFGNFSEDWKEIIIFLSIASMFLGSIASIAQKNLKRLLAYSSIGHVGYLLIGLVAANPEGIKGLIIYVTFYLLMNLVIFSIMLNLKYKDKHIEMLNDLSGMSKSRPFYSLCIGIVMLSMAGIPPFAGFFGKFYIFIAAIKADLVYLAVLGVLASVISAFYYLRIIKIMYFEDNEFHYDSRMSKKSVVLLIFSILIISLFILYPSLLLNLSSYISVSYF